MKYNGLSYSRSVQDMILSTALKRYRAVKYVLFCYSSFPILPLLPHLPLLQWIHKTSEKSGKWCAYPLGSQAGLLILLPRTAAENSGKSSAGVFVGFALSNRRIGYLQWNSLQVVKIQRSTSLSNRPQEQN